MKLITPLLLLVIAGAALASVPPVKPVHSKDYKIGVYYFPGWNSTARWMPIERAGYPKPLLGFYKEGDPEVAEWHLKWAAEHGIDFFIYDWYWHQGGTSLTHALHQGYFNAQNRKYVQFCLLWANHNGPGSHSMKDFMEVTDYWIKNYFNRPEYFKVDGKPMVIFFTTGNVRRDLGGSKAVKEALLKIREKVKAAGFPGIYLVASQDFNAGNAAIHKEEGWDAGTCYNYPGAGMSGGNRGSYKRMVDGYEAIWKSIDADSQIPYLVPISPGWDNTPWAGDKALVRYGTTPALYEDMCRRAKRFTDERPAERAPRIVISEAWNEFGEGSYIEPTEEYGFGYLDAMRKVFTDADPRHKDITPKKLGKQVPQVSRPVLIPDWPFKADLEGWDVGQNLKSLEWKDGCLVAVASNNDPAITSAVNNVEAAKHPILEIRMKMDADGPAQLFWGGTNGPITEANSQRFEAKGDNRFHTYTIYLSRNPNWKGTVSILRFDPNSVTGSTTMIDYIRLRQ